MRKGKSKVELCHLEKKRNRATPFQVVAFQSVYPFETFQIETSVQIELGKYVTPLALS